MWIATNRGFLSVVTANPAMLPKPEKKALHGQRPLCVRARKAGHLRTLFPDRTVYEFPGRDYPARIFIGNEDLARRMANEVRNIDYPNFKSSVKDNELHDAYMGVWSVMHRYQGGYYRRQAYSPLAQRQFAWGPGVSRRDNWDAPFNEQVPDDEPCTTPGCTDMNPCLDCIIDAMDAEGNRSEEELMRDADDAYRAKIDTVDGGEERYGDFDTGDDADDDSDATSYKRALGNG